MTQRLLNIFIYGNNTHVHSMGYCAYEKTGSYDELTEYLRSRVTVDHKHVARIKFKEPIERQEFYAMERLGAVTNTLGSQGVISEDTIYCITQIVDGKVNVDEIVDTLSSAGVPDYLLMYTTENKFDFPVCLKMTTFQPLSYYGMQKSTLRA